MKKIVSFFIIVFAVAVCGKAYAQQNVTTLSYDQARSYVQEKSNGSVMTFGQVEEKPKFQDGEPNAFIRWIYSELKYPEQAVQENLEGKVVMQFTISKDGSVKNVKVMRSTHPSFDEEAVRVIKSSPKWEPAKVKGEPVDIVYTMPVVFKKQNASVATFVMGVTPAEFVAPDKKEGDKVYPTSAEFTKWVFMNFKYPAEAKQQGIQGNANVAFDILESGEIDNVRIVKSAHPMLDEELVRVVKMSPKWKAAIQNGQPVRTTYTFPFRFVLR